MGSTVGAFLLALLICLCEASSDKDFSFSFLPENEGEEQIPSKANTKQDKEGVAADEEAARGLQTQMLAEAKKVEEAVRRLGSLRSSDKQEEETNQQGVVVSKAGALLLCSLYPDKSQLPEYCEGARVIGLDIDEDAAKKRKNDETSVTSKGVSDQDVGEKEESEMESALEEKIITKSTNKFQLLEHEHRYKKEESNQLTSIPSWLRSLGFRNFLQEEGESYGRPVGSYQTSNPAWYHTQQQGSPYQPYLQHLHLPLQHPGLPLQHPQQPAQHLHLHLPESTQLSSTNPDCQPGNFFKIEGKKYFLCESGSDATGENEEGAKSRPKRNSFLAWPFPTKVCPNQLSRSFFYLHIFHPDQDVDIQNILFLLLSFFDFPRCGRLALALASPCPTTCSTRSTSTSTSTRSTRTCPSSTSSCSPEATLSSRSGNRLRPAEATSSAPALLTR